MERRNKYLKRVAVVGVTLGAYSMFALPVLAQSNPTNQIVDIIARITTIMTQIGTAILTLVVVKDGITFANNSNPENRGMLLRDLGMLLISAIFMFKPEIIVSAIKFIANVQ